MTEKIILHVSCGCGFAAHGCSTEDRGKGHLTALSRGVGHMALTGHFVEFHGAIEPMNKSFEQATARLVRKFNRRSVDAR